MPGGFGTLEEPLEMITWQQLGYHKKPVGVLNVGGYFDLFEFLDRSAESGSLAEARHRGRRRTPDELLEKRKGTAPTSLIESLAKENGRVTGRDEEQR